MPAETNWKAVRRDYEGRTLRTAEILVKYDITAYALNKRIGTEDWTRRLSAVAAQEAGKPPAKTAAKKKATTLKPKAKSAKTSSVSEAVKPLKPIAQRRKILAHLHSSVTRKLALLEKRIEQQENGGKGAISAADFERDTRSIAQLIKSLEQATEFHHDQSGKRISGAAAKSASIAAIALADEADRLRRELAERLQRLVDPAGE